MTHFSVALGRCSLGAALFISAIALSSCTLFPRRTVRAPIIPPMPAWAMQANSGAPTASVSVDGNFEGVAGTPTSATGGMFDFSGMVQTSTQGLSQLQWHQNIKEATEKSRVEGKPLLILAAHKSSATSIAIESTLMIHPEFIELSKNFTMLRLDYSNRDVASSDSYRQFKERLKIRGYPNLFILLPDGSEILTLRGYKPEYQNRYLTQIKGSLKDVGTQVANRRKRLEKEQGYRLWSTPDGQGFFAKIVKLDANQITFHTEWDEVLKTFISRLAVEDQAWIEEKRLKAQTSSPSSS